MSIPTHVFLSYSTDDADIAKKLTDRLSSAGIPVWIDREKLSLGTPDWESSIRNALSKSFLVVLLASPSSRASIYVRGEIALAKSIGCEVFPLWVSGNSWIDSVPLDMAYSQYVDLRNLNDQCSFGALCSSVNIIIKRQTPKHYLVEDFEKTNRYDEIETATPPAGFVSVEIPILGNNDVIVNYFSDEKRAVFFNTKEYVYFGDLLDSLYMNYLSDIFLPYTYGVEWVICVGHNYDMKFKEVLIPFSWVHGNFSFFENEKFFSLKTSEIMEEKYFFIRRVSKLKTFCLLLENENIFNAIKRRTKALYFLINSEVLKSSKDLPKKEFKYKYIFCRDGYFADVDSFLYQSDVDGSEIISRFSGSTL